MIQRWTRIQLTSVRAPAWSAFARSSPAAWPPRREARTPTATPATCGAVPAGRLALVNIRRPSRPPAPGARAWVLLAGVLVAVGLLGFTAGTASAATRAAAEARVGAFSSDVGVLIGPSVDDSPAQGRVDGPPPVGFVVATGVAPKGAGTSVDGFGGLSRAGDFGAWPYRTLKVDLKGTGLDAYHLIEQRLARVMGQAPRDMASVAVARAEHWVFTNAWRQAIPYGAGTRNATLAQIENAARQIYANYPDILSALGLG